MAISNGYCSLAEIKAAARIPSSDTQDDALLELSVEAASRSIDAHTGRHFYQSGTAVRYYVPASSIVCNIDDVAGTATVAISSAADGVYDITLGNAYLQYEPLNRRVAGLAFPATRLRMIGDYSFPTTPYSGETTVRVQANFGFGTVVPTEIKQAAIVLASRFYKRFDSPLGVAGFGDMGAMRVSRVDPDVQAILTPFVHSDAVGVA